MTSHHFLLVVPKIKSQYGEFAFSYNAAQICTQCTTDIRLVSVNYF